MSSNQLICGDNCFHVAFNGRQDPKYDRNADLLLSLVAALANGAGGVIFLTTVDEHNALPSKKDKETFRMSLLNFLKTGLSQFNPQSVLLDDFDDRVGDSRVLVWMLMLVKMFPTHVFAETTEENAKEIYRVSENGEIVFQHVDVPNTQQGVVGSGEDQGSAAASGRTSGLTGHTASEVPTLLPEQVADVQDEAITRMLFEDKPEQLSWTAHTTNWRKHLTVRHNGLIENVDKLIQTSGMLKPDDPLLLTPRLEQFKYLFPSPETADKIFQEITNIIGGSKAFGLVSKAWSTSFKSNTSLQCPSHHVADILVISQECFIYLFTVVTQTGITLQNQLEYMFATGRLTKNHLLKKRSVGHDLCVRCVLLSTCSEPYNQPKSTIVIQETMARFFQTRNDLEFIQKSLSVMLLIKDTFFKSVLGEDRLYDLSADQTRVIFASTTNKLTLVHGPPGSGKSLIATHIARRANNKDHVLFVSSTEAFQKFIDYQNIATTAVAKSDKDLAELFAGGISNTKQIIILDDAQNMGCSESTLQKLLTFLNLRRECQLYIFVDNKYQCYEDKSHALRSTNPFLNSCSKAGIEPIIYQLGEVHRNTQKVMSFLAASVAGITPDSAGLTCVHDWVGDDVEVRAAGNILADTRQNSIVTEVFKLTEKKPFPLDSRGYIMSDISILLDTDNTEQDIRHLRDIIQTQIPNIKVITACDYPRDGIAVDEIDNFYGLDSRVCFFVLSSSRIKADGGPRNISNPRYRAFLASRAVEKAVFFVPKLDVDVFKTLLFDNPVVGVYITVSNYAFCFSPLQNTNRWSCKLSHFFVMYSF